MSAANAVLDSTIRELIDELAVEKAPPIYTMSPEEARKTLLRVQSGPLEKPHAQIKDYSINTTAGPLYLRSIRPIGVKTSYCRRPVFSRRRLGPGGRGYT